MAKMDPVVHFEMPSEDRKRMRAFYEKTFGWKTEQLGPEMGEYVLVGTTEVDENKMPTKPGAINGGFFDKKDSPVKQPLIVIAVDDIKESMKKVTDAGGKVMGEPMDIPGVGPYVYFHDTEGNAVGMIQPMKK